MELSVDYPDTGLSQSFFLKSKASQGHGFDWENTIRTEVFDLKEEENNTDKYDIPRKKNNLNENENISIKTTGNQIICTSDILRFYNYDFEYENTIILIKYKQEEESKIIENVYEINYSKELHTHLFGTLTEGEIETYVKNVKMIPATIKGDKAREIFDYLVEKKNIYKNHPTLKVKINPKVDSSQSRVQCSVDIRDIPNEFIAYDSLRDVGKPNIIRNKEIKLSVCSSVRKRGGITVKKLNDICKQHKLKGYSALNKQSKIDLLNKNNIPIPL